VVEIGGIILVVMMGIAEMDALKSDEGLSSTD